MTFTSRLVPLPINNVDTDQIIPARFLKTISKQGLDKQLFHDWRYDAQGHPKPDFILNHPRTQGAQVLLAGDNFGCGSSREHAPWALTQFGFRAVISTSFADIFKQNSLKNALLPIVLPADAHAALFALVDSDPDVEVTVDLAHPNGHPAGRPKSGFPHRSVFQALPAGRRGRTGVHPEKRSRHRGV